MGSYRLFAFRRDEPDNLRRERLPLELVGFAVTWAAAKGCEVILVEADDRDPFPLDSRHHVCSDPACPGGC